MSSRALFRFACVLVFQLAIAKCNNRKCGENSFEIGSDSSIQATGEGFAREGMWPWMVAIIRKESADSDAFQCSGFLIDRKHIISAAHCFDRKDVEEYMARVGSINRDEGDEYRITRIAVPSNYTAGKHYGDIAILTLDRRVDFGDYNPICLPDVHTKMDLAGRRTAIAGWNIGLFSSLEKDLKYQTGLKVIPNEECEGTFYRAVKERFQRQFPSGINRDVVCAIPPEGVTDECSRIASGAPLMVQHENRWIAVGVMSFGLGCSRPGIPDGYVNIPNYLKWIKQNTRH